MKSPEINLSCATCKSYKYFDMVCRKKKFEILLPHNHVCFDWMPHRKSVVIEMCKCTKVEQRDSMGIYFINGEE